MPITQRTSGNVTVIYIDDVFTHRNRKDFASAVRTFKESAGKHLIVDLHDASYIDSAAVGLLALTSQQLAVDERMLSLVGPQGTVKTILEMANLDKMIPVFSTQEAAAEARAA